MVKYCQKCGAKLDDDAIFCDECGESTTSSLNNTVSKSDNFKFNKLGILAVALIIVIIVALCVVYDSSTFQTNTSLIGDDDSSFYNGDKFSVTLIDADSNKLANKTIQLSFTNSNDETKDFDVTTDSKGRAKLELNLDSGEYSVVGLFEGDDTYKSSSFNQTITIKTKESSSSSTTSTLRETPESEYNVYAGEYKTFTILIDGQYVTESLPWDSSAGCYHW